MTLPGGPRNNHYYAYHLGPALIVVFNTEYYLQEWSFWKMKYVYSFEVEHKQQDRWLRSVLKDANKPKNRREHPWLIVLAHRPMYCNNGYLKGHMNNFADCTSPYLLPIIHPVAEMVRHKFKFEIASRISHISFW